MATLGQKPATQHVSLQKQTITGNGGTSYTLQQSVSQASDIEVFVNNTRQEPTVAYTASGTTLTMTGAVNASDSFYVIFQGKAIQTAGLPVDAAITASTITTSQTITSTGNITTTGTVNTPSINSGQIGGRRNIIINGAMQVAQRGTSSTSTGFQTCDRIQFLTNNTDNFAFTVSQSSTAPDGFSTSQKLDCTTAETSLDADELARFLYKVEGQDIQHFNYGSSASEEVTVSFYVRSNVTGVYTVEFRLNAAGTSTITKQYTISSANTWERKILNLPKNTVTSVDNDNSNGIEISFCVAAGSNFTTGSLGTSWATTATSSRYAGQAANIMSSTDNEWYITGLQMEIGSQATAFEHRSFGEELALCQRYFYAHADGRNGNDAHIGTGTYYTSSAIFSNVKFPVSMRTKPTLESPVGTNYYIAFRNGAGDHFDEIITFSNHTTTEIAELKGQTNASGTAGHGTFLRLGGTSTTARLFFDAEL